MQAPRTATVVLPAYGVAPALPSIVRDLAVAAHGMRTRGITLDVLVLHDGRDDAAERVEKAAAELGLALRTAAGPDEPGAAYLEGFRQVLAEDAGPDLIITLDANGRHDATVIPRLVDRMLADGLHVVIGSRWARGSGTPGLSVPRWIMGRLANLTFRLLTGTRGVSDATTSFRVARREVFHHFDLADIPVNSHSVQTAFVAVAVANGFRIGEGPIIYGPALAGGDGLQLDDISGFARHLSALRRHVDRARQRRLSPVGRVFDDDAFGAADDLERLGTAKYFFDWVLDEFRPYLHGRLLEVGAGLGTITRKLIDRDPELTIVALEPASNVFEDLASVTALTPRVEAHRCTLAEYARDRSDRFDAVVYLNVLEHIDDDAGELRRAAEVLRPGGAVLVFGPALEWLYSDLDYKAGHYRRYTVADLRRLAEDAGLDVIKVTYFDVLGVAPYLLVYRLLRHTDISSSSMWGYDRVVVPLSRFLQRLLRRPPLGKNVILIARRP
ncbi:MAG: methyltransferase domain-containing protein [Actinomycetota bacterium]|nr:methyltransferase domain-containing protein [Actinomycetota bacterium]